MDMVSSFREVSSGKVISLRLLYGKDAVIQGFLICAAGGRHRESVVVSAAGAEQV